MLLDLGAGAKFKVPSETNGYRETTGQTAMTPVLMKAGTTEWQEAVEENRRGLAVFKGVLAQHVETLSRKCGSELWELDHAERFQHRDEIVADFAIVLVAGHMAELPSVQILRSRIMDRYSGVPTR